MATYDIFNDDAFTLSSLTSAIQAIPFAPGRIAQLGLFSEDGINTKTAQVELEEGVLSLVSVSQRGAPVDKAGRGTRTLRAFTIPHLKQADALLADEILGVRSFGTESEVETMVKVVSQRLSAMRRNLEYTNESHRLAAIMGTYYNAAGASVSLFTEFGVSQQTLDMDLDVTTTEVRGKALTILENIEDALGGLSFTGVRVLCGKTFWNSLITHKMVKESYLNTLAANTLRGDPRMEFEFAGIIWERYRGTSAVKVADGEAFAIPEGVVDLFITRYAPADYVECVGTLGQSLYAKQWEMEAGRGINLESQTNPLNLCTRPRAIIKLTA